MKQLASLTLLVVTLSLTGCVDCKHEYIHSSHLSEREKSSSPPCPPGFNGEPCGCVASQYKGLTNCDGGRAHILRGYWVGLCENALCTGLCPTGFCLYNNSTNYRLPGTVSELDEYMCGETRTGVLCGECRTNYSASYHSHIDDCITNDLCEYGWLLYIASELLPLSFVFIIVTFFKVSFTSGAINSFILFAQLQDTFLLENSGLIFSTQYNLISASKFVYRFFNFNFFSAKQLSFCLWRGATVLDATAFKYVTILFGFALMFICVYVMNSYRMKRCFSCLRPTTLRSSLIHGLTAFFVMCYSQCAMVSLRILYSVNLYGENLLYVKTVVFFSGQLSMLEPAHLKYAIPAIFFSSTILLFPPVVLILYPLLGKVLACCNLSETRFVNFISRFVPMQLLDSFQSSFRDRVRFFAGFYFLYRLIPLVVFFLSHSLSSFYITLEVLFILLMTIHAVVQPHKKRRHNVVDVLLFADLAIINAVSFFHYHKTTLGSNKLYVNHFLISILSLTILICLPFACLLLAAVIKIWKLAVARYKKRCRSMQYTPETQTLLDSSILPPLRETSK